MSLEPLKISNESILSFSLPLSGIYTKITFNLHFVILTQQQRWHEPLCSTQTAKAWILDRRQAEIKAVLVPKGSLEVVIVKGEVKISRVYFQIHSWDNSSRNQSAWPESCDTSLIDTGHTHCRKFVHKRLSINAAFLSDKVHMFAALLKALVTRSQCLSCNHHLQLHWYGEGVCNRQREKKGTR